MQRWPVLMRRANILTSANATSAKNGGHKCRTRTRSRRYQSRRGCGTRPCACLNAATCIALSTSSIVKSGGPIIDLLRPDMMKVTTRGGGFVPNHLRIDLLRGGRGSIELFRQKTDIRRLGIKVWPIQSKQRLVRKGNPERCHCIGDVAKRQPPARRRIITSLFSAPRKLT